MKRKIIAAVLCLCLVAALFPATAVLAAGDVCFISVNDTLLELSSMPYYKDGEPYVPYWVFKDFNIRYTYFNEGSTAMIYRGDKVAFFEMTTGVTYDIEGVYYDNVEAVFQNSAVYLPVDFMCRYFEEMTWSYLHGEEYGDVLRIRDASVIISDSDFIPAASSLMKRRYNAYKNGYTDSGRPNTGDGEMRPDNSGTKVYISVVGLPSGELLSMLTSAQTKACFYLDEESVRSDPDMVRRIAAEGHRLGVLCGEDILKDYERVSALIFKVARVQTRLVTAVQGDTELSEKTAEENGLVFWKYNLDAMASEDRKVYASVLADAVENLDGDISIFTLSCEETESFLPLLLNYLKENQYSLACPNETNCPK